jgi:hypothetical protein
MTKECPACSKENAEEADTCKHCGTAFFYQPESLIPPLDNAADDLVIIGRYNSLVEADIVAGLLQAHEIEACIPEELMPPIFSSVMTRSIEVITVRVAAKDVEAARKVIATR